QFLLLPHDPAYTTFDARFPFLFNSYYVAAGPRHARPQRGLITRPNGAEVASYRAHVDKAVTRLIETVKPSDAPRVFEILEIGLHHEQQHQELLLTDILHAFAQNPTDPAYDAAWQPPHAAQGPRGAFVDVPAGIHSVGHDGDGFCFDNETPRHDELIAEMRIARHLVTNAEWLEFMKSGGYSTPSLWLSDGWAMVEAEAWQAPGYWRQKDGAWFSMTLSGLKPVDPAAPVCPIRATGPPKARWANITASSWSIRWCCAALLWRRRKVTRGRATAISSIHRRAGNSAGCGLPS